MKKWPMAAVGVDGIVLATGAMAQTRFHENTAKFRNLPNPAIPPASGDLSDGGRSTVRALGIDTAETPPYTHFRAPGPS